MLIGITGYKQVGKTTMAEILEHSEQFEHETFAGKLKEIVRDLYGLTEEQVNGPVELKEQVIPAWGKSPREIMQLFGTEVTRSVHPDTWVRYLVNRIKWPVEIGFDFVISDVRFPNEAEAIKKLGGVIVRVYRPGYGGDGHASETSIQQIAFDHLITNDGTLQQFSQQILNLLDRLRQD